MIVWRRSSRFEACNCAQTASRRHAYAMRKIQEAECRLSACGAVAKALDTLDQNS